ncbi:bladder cancer-related protein BC10 domain-containing protein [Trichoderma gracile]
MFCLRSWLPLLFIPTNASPAFIFLFFICTYFLNRPCVYCSVLLVILFLTSCNWSDRCCFDLSSNWFLPRPPTTTSASTTTIITSSSSSLSSLQLPPNHDHAYNDTVVDMLNTTAKAAARAAAEEIAVLRNEWTGLGVEWLRNLLGKREWRIDCMDIYIRL